MKRAPSIYQLTLRFVLICLSLLTLSRLLLLLWLNDRVSQVDGWWPSLIGGLRVDVILIAILILIPMTIAPWVGQNRLAQTVIAWWYRGLIVLVVFMEVASPTFIAEYDSRPNRLFVEYLVSPIEVGGMLLSAYPIELIVAGLAVIAAGYASRRVFPTSRSEDLAMVTPHSAMAIRWRVAASLTAALVLGLAARGTLAHRPFNPSMVAFGNDSLVNTLPVNSLYNVVHALYRTRSERSSREAYGSMSIDLAQARVLGAAGIAKGEIDASLPSLHSQTASVSSPKPKHIVMVIEESLGAQFVSHLGGKDLTPNLDKLSKEGWTFLNAFATGTRSARGLEALTTGFLPTPSESVLKLPRSQSGFFTLAQLLGRHGYRSRFVYGGEAHFDNMRAFFLGNGFDEVVDLPRFESPRFVGTWGASDGDMFRKLDSLLSNDADDAPTFTVAFSVSNHSPWEFPHDRIKPEGVPDRDDAIRYADMALGEFFDKAQRSPYWDRTVFLIAADHDARAGGASLLPVNNFHIPAMFVGKGIAPRMDDQIVSQVDLPPTLLSLAGVSSSHPMVGADLTTRRPSRAIMQFGDNYGYLASDVLTVLEPGRQPKAFRVDMRTRRAISDAPVDADQAQLALAHALWAEWMYREGRYALPTDLKNRRSGQ